MVISIVLIKAIDVLIICTMFLLFPGLTWSSDNKVPVHYPVRLEELRRPTDLAALAPEILARQMIKNRETRFIGIAGFAVDVPGVQTDRCDVIRATVYVLPGTGDNVDISIELRNQVLRVARDYNAIMKRHLSTRAGAEHFLRRFP